MLIMSVAIEKLSNQAKKTCWMKAKDLEVNEPYKFSGCSRQTSKFDSKRMQTIVSLKGVGYLALPSRFDNLDEECFKTTTCS